MAVDEIEDTKVSDSYDCERFETLLVESMKTVKWPMDMGINLSQLLAVMPMD